jgi:AbrB family looped-hinge helix DNA binding protein
METVRVLARGQIVIPAALRRKYGIQPGTDLQMFEYGNLIYLMPPAEDPILEAMGCLPESPSLADELLEERRKDFAS